MKRYLLILFFATSIIAYGSETGSVNNVQIQTDNKVIQLDKLLENADGYVNKKVRVTGYVTHTCKHSGRRCFLTGESQKFTVRVEAKGKIGGFNRELVGSKIEVEGVLKERRLTTEEIDAMEKKIQTKRVANDGSSESCDAETANVQKMRAWMKSKGKNYYSIYYIDGETYNEVE